MESNRIKKSDLISQWKMRVSPKVVVVERRTNRLINNSSPTLESVSCGIGKAIELGPPSPPALNNHLAHY